MAFQHKWNNNSSRFVSRHARIQEFSSGGGGGGGSRSICHKNPWQRFYSSFLVVLHLFYRMPMVYFKENYNFPRFQRGSNIFPRGGVQLFLGGGGGGGGGGSNCLFPIESHITCVFPGGSGPLGPPLDQCMQYFAVKKVNYEKKLSILTPPPSPGYS